MAMADLYHAALVQDSQCRWDELVTLLHPGSWVVVHQANTLAARSAGFEVRDSLFCATADGPLIVWLLRKPLSEPTVVKQVLTTGTGGINIDGSRVEFLGSADKDSAKPAGASTSRSGCLVDGQDNDSKRVAFEWEQPTGRFPSNFYLLHTATCVESAPASGQKKSAPDVRVRKPSAVHTAKGGHQTPGRQRLYRVRHDDGTETARSFKCTAGCPALELSGQSGITRSCAATRHHDPYSGTSHTALLRGVSSPDNQRNDTGSATRFFYQATTLDQLFGYLADMITPPNGSLLRT